MNNIEVNVLISSAGRRGALYCIFKETVRTLGGGRVFAADMSSLSAVFQMADRSFILPRCTDPQFIPRMLEICQEHNVALVVPTIDTELMSYAQSREAFQRIGTTVAVSSTETIDICGDKNNTHAWLVSKGFPTVQQRLAKDLVANTQDRKHFPFPLLVKPIGGSSSIGVEIIHGVEELEKIAGKGEYLVQTLARGSEFTVDIYIDRKGSCRCAVPRKRLETRAGEVSKALSVRDHAVMELARSIGETLPGAFGVLNIQIFKDPENHEMKVIEMNPRFGGGFPLSYNAGANYPLWLIQEILGQNCQASWDGWRDHQLMLRYDDAVFVNGELAGLQP